MLLVNLALAAPVLDQSGTVAEEVIVYADPLAPWDDTRWLVKLETASWEERLTVDAARGQVTTWLWQVRAVIHCDVVERRNKGGLVACSPERVGLAVVTDDRWQRQVDRAMVEDVVNDVRATMLEGEVRLRVKDHGAARVLHEPLQVGDDTIASVLLHRVFDGFQLDLPDEGFYDGVQWTSTDEPLLKLRAGYESFGAEVVVHVGSAYRGTQLIQSRGEAQKETVIELQDVRQGAPRSVEERFEASYDANDEMKINHSMHETTISRTLAFDAAAILDRERGFVTERVWTVEGKRGIRMRRLGRLLLLGDDDQPDLGLSGQVSPPDDPRPHLPAWTPLET